MESNTMFSTGSILLLAAFLLATIPARCSAQMAGDIEAIIPSPILLPAGSQSNQLFFAVGFQIYIYTGGAWVQQNVSADLYDGVGAKYAHHYYLSKEDANGGIATWATFNPVSTITAKAIGDVPQVSSIPWLLLKATSYSGLSYNPGGFGSTLYV